MPDPISQYGSMLKNLEDSILINEKKFVTELKNILKTSTVGSNTQISTASDVFWESGFDSAKVCSTHNFKRIRTSAATLDPLPKDNATEIFNPNVHFDERFTNRLGFVQNIVWTNKATDTNRSEVTINFGPEENKVSGFVVNTKPTSRGAFEELCLGNNEKNYAVNQLFNVTKFDKAHIIRLLVMKELGDVAQVWMYLAYVYIMGLHINNERTKALMVTTDNVVYIFCMMLRLTCMNTGSREGVKSGCCTLKYYLPGEQDFNLKLKNMTTVHYNRLLQQNSSIIMGLRIMKLDKSKFKYYTKSGRSGLRVIFANRRVTIDNVSNIDNLIETYIKDIEEKMSPEIENIFTEVSNMYFNDDTPKTTLKNDKDVSDIFADFVKNTKSYKCYQLFTKLKNGHYVLLPGKFLTNFVEEIGNTESLPENVDEIYKFLADNNIETSYSSSFGGALQRGGQNILNQNYYECMLLCFIFYKFFYNKNIDLSGNENAQIIFAMIYDAFVYKLEEEGSLQGLNDFLDTSLEGYIDTDNGIVNITDDEIFKTGNYLSTYIDFAKDFNEENTNLQSTAVAKGIVKRYSNYFNPKGKAKVYSKTKKMSDQYSKYSKYFNPKGRAKKMPYPYSKNPYSKNKSFGGKMTLKQQLRKHRTTKKYRRTNIKRKTKKIYNIYDRKN
jgi:hypothetical protein